MPSRLASTLCGVPLKTPVLAASGTYAYGVELKGLVDFGALGGLIVKGLSHEPMDGNPPPRLVETLGGMINSVGLQNIGVRAFVRDKLPGLRNMFREAATLRGTATELDPATAIFANIFGFAVEDYVEVARVLEDAEGLAGYELNVSCPNTKHGGIQFSADPALLAEVVTAVRTAVKSTRPLIVKLSPNVARIQPMACAAADAGADAISLVNTFVSLAIDAQTRKPRIGAGFGGLSGPAIKPIALRMVYEVSCAVSIPVVGIGGIANGIDAAEFMIAGASAVEVGTANFWDPESPVRIARELEQFLERENISSAVDLVGTLKFGLSHN